MATQSRNILNHTTNQLEPTSSQHEVPVIWQYAKGCYVWDTEMKRYLDFTSGIFVANTGHNPPEVVKAIRCQAEKVIHSYAFPNEPRSKLVKKLIGMTGMEKVFLCSTGSEAVEAAMRCMWAKRRGKILGITGANHGRTFGASRVIGKRLLYDNFPNQFKPADISGLIFETYEGWSARFHPMEWIQEWCRWAGENDIPVCFDEIQSGFGRTGKMFGYEHYGVSPNLICVGKALGGGLPISAVIGNADLLDAPSDLSSTHTGNPVCCAAALANLGVLERDNLVSRAKEMGTVIKDLLPQVFPEYTVLGEGMVWAINLKDVDLANLIVFECAKRGLLLVKTGRGTIKIGAPLTTPESEILRGIKIIREALDVCLSATLE